MTADAADVMAADRTMSSADASTAVTNYLALAQGRVVRDMDGITLSAGESDRLEALMICHLWHTSDPMAGLRSFSSGDLSISQDPGSTVFLIEYRSTIQEARTAESDLELAAVKRADADMTGLALDQADVPSYYEEDLE